MENTYKIALIGNPNVGKSTVFNGLTGLRQHTGNWPGKTVTNAVGSFEYNKKEYLIYDLPGTYSLIAHSEEEEVARDFICNKEYNVAAIVCDACCLERNLNLVLQVLQITKNVIVCVNLLDEAKKKKINVDLKLLEEKLGVPVIGMSARSGKGIDKLLQKIDEYSNEICTIDNECEVCKIKQDKTDAFIKKAEKIAKNVVTFENKNYDKKERKIDRVLTNKITGIPIMLLLLFVILWITIEGANYPSQILFNILFDFGEKIRAFLTNLSVADWLVSLLISGIYRVLAWVTSVMLPPMAIFFPLFTLLEDFGVLPRIAFNLDKLFKKCNACGKQALTMCMGFGCNSCGVTGCRIIDSPREKLIAIVTNNFVPCNGRFPTLISIISMFFVFGINENFKSFVGALLLTLVILFGIFMTFLVSKILSKTLLKGKPSSFTLELPPYRKPQIGKVIVRSILDRTLFVLGRAVIIAIPAGLIIWMFANFYIDGTSLLMYFTNFLDPFAKLIGLDGVILMAFILGFPANEIVVPIILMAYLATGEIVDMSNLVELKNILIANGWTWVTAICTIMFSLMHWPCSTTILTIKKETKSLKWTLLSCLIPTACGIIVCFTIATIGRLFI